MNLSEKSDENFKAAQLLKANKYFKASCSRYYYAMFLKIKYFCESKLEYQEARGYGSHKSLIDYYRNFTRSANYSDVAILSRVQNISIFLNTAKSYRVQADYKNESEIDEEICDDLERYYNEIQAVWYDLIQIAEENSS